MLKKLSYILLGFALIGAKGFAQTTAQDQFESIGLNPITTAVPFLLISPDSRGGAMGDAGVASSPDANAMHWNAAKLAFIDKSMGVSVAYTPWLRSLVPDINLAYLSGYYRVNKRTVIGSSLRYFSLGQIDFTNNQGQSIGSATPNEVALDLGLAQKLSDNLSGGFSLRYIFSNLTGGIDPNTFPANAIAADLSMYYDKEVKLGDKDGTWAWGLNISNIGNRVSYTDSGKKDFIPINMKLGTRLGIELDEFNEISFLVDFNKLLVPTLPVYLKTESGQDSVNTQGEKEIAQGMDPDVGVAQGMFQSFYDAPGGFKEEMQEINLSFGMEYWYDKQFAIRAGYFYEPAEKGNRRFFTIGAGLKYKVFNLDFSYLITTNQQSPLQNTLRFSLLFNFDDIKAESESAE